MYLKNNFSRYTDRLLLFLFQFQDSVGLATEEEKFGDLDNIKYYTLSHRDIHMCLSISWVFIYCCLEQFTCLGEQLQRMR